MMLCTLNLPNNRSLSAEEVELDTIIQAADGNDYVVVNTERQQVWQLFHDNAATDIADVPFDLCHIQIRNPEENVKKKKKGRPAQNINNKQVTKQVNNNTKDVTLPRGRGRPRKVIDENNVRKPRQPTAYNLFLQAKLKELSSTYPDINNKERMRMASELWKAHKAED